MEALSVGQVPSVGRILLSLWTAPAFPVLLAVHAGQRRVKRWGYSQCQLLRGPGISPAFLCRPQDLELLGCPLGVYVTALSHASSGDGCPDWVPTSTAMEWIWVLLEIKEGC